MEKVEAFKCKTCGEIFNEEENAYSCEFKHIQRAYANCLLNEGYDLSYINYCCGFNRKRLQKIIVLLLVTGSAVINPHIEL